MIIPSPQKHSISGNCLFDTHNNSSRLIQHSVCSGDVYFFSTTAEASRKINLSKKAYCIGMKNRFTSFHDLMDFNPSPSTNRIQLMSSFLLVSRIIYFVHTARIFPFSRVSEKFCSSQFVELLNRNTVNLQGFQRP